VLIMIAEPITRGPGLAAEVTDLVIGITVLSLAFAGWAFFLHLA
jgi:hypothetical protein